MKNKLIRSLIPPTLLPLIAHGQTNDSSKTASVPAVNSAASAEPAGDNMAETVKAKLGETYTGQNLKVVSVSETPLKGIYEAIVTGKQVIYTDASGDYMLMDNFIDINKRQSITEKRIAELNRIDSSTLPLDKAVREVYGSGELRIAVFSDPDYPFYKRLEHEPEKVIDTTTYNFMMPISSLHPDAACKAEPIWCQRDHTRVWTEWMRKGRLPENGRAGHNGPVAETTSLGEQPDFTGILTLVFPNGGVQSGHSLMPMLKGITEKNQ